MGPGTHLRRGDEPGATSEWGSKICIHSGLPRTTSTLARSHHKVDLATAFGRIDEPWDPCVVADVNEFQVKLARMEGEFVWHHHEEEDELFLVVRGRMRMQFRPEHGGDIELGPGELIAVPRGVEHCPLAGNPPPTTTPTRAIAG